VLLPPRFEHLVLSPRQRKRGSGEDTHSLFTLWIGSSAKKKDREPQGHEGFERNRRTQRKTADKYNVIDVDDRSKKIIEAKRSIVKRGGNENLDTSTLLFEESRFIEERKQDKARQEMKKFVFKPIINKKSDTLVKLLGKNFYQRLEVFNQHKASKLGKLLLQPSSHPRIR
jgi:hypothetical protein